jgi:hypothetical protein
MGQLLVCVGHAGRNNPHHFCDTRGGGGGVVGLCGFFFYYLRPSTFKLKHFFPTFKPQTFFSSQFSIFFWQNHAKEYSGCPCLKSLIKVHTKKLKLPKTAKKFLTGATWGGGGQVSLATREAIYRPRATCTYI